MSENNNNSDKKNRRDFLTVATTAVGAVGVGAAVWPVINQMNPDSSVKALASTEVDLSKIKEGQEITVLWRGKPVFIKRRTKEEIASAEKVDLKELKRAGGRGAISIVLGVLISFTAGAALAVAFGYRDAISITTIGAGAATYIVGPVTGSAIGATSDIIALSVAAGLVKSILVMTCTPLVARLIGLNNPSSALVFGGLMGTTSGVAAGLAATDPKLVPYGAMTATFYTGVGCLLAPSILYLLVKAIVE